jgi:hypothetical protein
VSLTPAARAALEDARHWTPSETTHAGADRLFRWERIEACSRDS